MGQLEYISVNGWLCAALVAPLVGGYRVEFAEEDWDSMETTRGMLIQFGRLGKSDGWATIAEVTRQPPIVFVVFIEKNAKRSA